MLSGFDGLSSFGLPLLSFDRGRYREAFGGNGFENRSGGGGDGCHGGFECGLDCDCCQGRWLGLSGGGGEAFAAADAFEEEFGYVFDGDVFGVGFAGSAAEHALAEGAAYGEDLFAGGWGEGLLGFAEAVVGDALVALLFFLPELGSAGAAAEGVFAVAGKLRDVVGEDVEQVARGFVDAVVAAEVAGVVVGDGGCRCGLG